MASVVTSHEKWACKEDNDDFEAVKINSAFLMSLMEELQYDQMEDADEERLKSLIQSLEAEINSSTTTPDVDHHSPYMEYNHDHQSFSEAEDSRSCSLRQMDDCDYCAISFHDLDMNGLIEMEEMPCSPSHDLINWYRYPCADEITSNDYSTHAYNHGVALDQEYGYNSLWQETTYDSVMYE